MVFDLLAVGSVDVRPIRWETRRRRLEGLVVKGAATPYLPGTRAWRKVKHRATVEVLGGGVLGPIQRPEVVIAG